MAIHLRKSASKFWRRVVNRLAKGRRILVIGDSHGGIFEYCFDRGLLSPHWLNCEIVAGATAYGLNNDHAATGAWHKFSAALERFSRFDVVVIVLGECDCSYALWKKAESCSIVPTKLIAHSLRGISRLVAKISSSPCVRRIILVGACLPSIEDRMASSQENVLRREIAATQRERTNLVLEYNRRLAGLAEELGVKYFDLTDETMDKQTGLLSRSYAAGPDDHHLSHSASGLLWTKALQGVL